MRIGLVGLVLAVGCGDAPEQDPQRAADSAMIERLGGTFSDSAYRRADSIATVAEVKSAVRNALIAMEEAWSLAKGYPTTLPDSVKGVRATDQARVEVLASDDFRVTIIRPDVATCTATAKGEGVTCTP